MSNLFFREFGSGKPLIVLHGLLGCSDNWIFHGKKLSNFLRMLNVSIPSKSFDFINSYALLLIDQERNLVEAGLNL